MKAVMIVYNQSISDEVYEILDKVNIRGFTRWTDVHGRGSEHGEPHYGTHIWPSLNSVILTVVEDERAEPILVEIRKVNEIAGEEGIRAFVWQIEQMAG